MPCDYTESPFVQPAQVQDWEASITSSSFLGPHLSWRSASPSPGSGNCFPPSTFTPHLRLSLSNMHVLVPSKSQCHQRPDERPQRRGSLMAPSKAALLPLSYPVCTSSTSLPTMEFSLPLNLTKSFVILLKCSRAFSPFSNHCSQCLPNALDLPLLVFIVNTFLTRQ